MMAGGLATDGSSQTAPESLHALRCPDSPSGLYPLSNRVFTSPLCRSLSALASQAHAYALVNVIVALMGREFIYVRQRAEMRRSERVASDVTGHHMMIVTSSCHYQYRFPRSKLPDPGQKQSTKDVLLEALVYMLSDVESYTPRL